MWNSTSKLWLSTLWIKYQEHIYPLLFLNMREIFYFRKQQISSVGIPWESKHKKTYSISKQSTYLPNNTKKSVLQSKHFISSIILPTITTTKYGPHLSIGKGILIWIFMLRGFLEVSLYVMVTTSHTEII